jgi:hypothetical protein
MYCKTFTDTIVSLQKLIIWLFFSKFVEIYELGRCHWVLSVFNMHYVQLIKLAEYFIVLCDWMSWFFLLLRE